MLIQQETLDKFKRILDAIEWAFPGSRPVIGGGALRDSILGRQPKDVDVFIRFEDYQTLDSSLTRLVPCPTISQSYGRADMHGAWDFLQDIEGFPVQLILADFKGHVDLAHTFDLNLSRIAYDGSYVYITEDFMKGVKDRTFRICRADNDYEVQRSTRRIERLRSEKFQGYAFEPPVFQFA